MTESHKCWCGNAQFDDFSTEYYHCPQCETLVLKRWPEEDLTAVQDEGELYSRDYYLEHLPSYGYPDLPSRTRNDLPERNLHWLRALLTYRLPPGCTLEVGCAHGAFVYLLQQCGFDATGLELSPWLVKYAHETFAIPVLQGPIEKQDLPCASLDVILMMDVLEHLQQPEKTLHHLLALLKEDGLLMIQMPDYPAGQSYSDIAHEKPRFLEHLKPREHLHLWSKQAACQLLERAGLLHVTFLEPIFDHDMFLVASRQPPEMVSAEQRDAFLQGTPQQRLILALLDLYEQKEIYFKAANERLLVIDKLKRVADERLQVINQLNRTLQTKRRCLLKNFLQRFVQRRSQ